MVPETLELAVEGGRISHSWCMCVVSHGNGGLDGGARMEVVDGMHAGQSHGAGGISGEAGARSVCEVIH